MFKQNDRVLFGRGPIEFLGVVIEAALDKAVVRGVETGCLCEQQMVVTVDCLEYLRAIGDEEWEQRILDEPAFADTMTRDRYVALQEELETLELSIAKGQETDATDFRIQVIELLMSKAPWQLCPDEGCIPRVDLAPPSSSPYVAI